MLVSLLLSAGSCQDSLPIGCASSGSLLHLAIRNSGYISGQEIAFLLIKAGADLAVEDCEKRTALCCAVYVNNCELVEELLRLGSSPWRVNTKTMETAGKEINTLLDTYRNKVPGLQEMASRSIRRAVARSLLGGLPFVDKIDCLPLPQKLKDFIS